ncbi:hypothetical protein GGI04_003380 [Coemansia thaxteri]|uniref:AMP-dependent synthetase/ligase domain-containing protein n=1 Tax=Coemansia thaxteri TaxID=2663907 RepID=A0A9W8BPG8_9FUNG|nr:hypothetical protein GGI04_003380 [Coemansia thaxteri]KAJ2008635.1 hypothetical protein H4R26_000116 [Coemansia thaxteri]KAJ2468382.1 hypothetical protein GGI02_003713 [Coemansia sp. RSA 2322]KAJ2488119.1 hypothetical protein EV174_000079 [Coemansia sp. RSA 2320]
MLVASPLRLPPMPAGDVPSHVFRFAESRLEDVVLVDAETEQSFTIGDIISTSTRLAAGLSRAGYGGQVVSVFDNTNLRCVYVYYAALLMGGTYQSLGTDASAAELRDRIQKTPTSVVFTTRAYLDRLKEATHNLGIAMYILDHGFCKCRTMCAGPDTSAQCMSFVHQLIDDAEFTPVRITSLDHAMRQPAYLAYVAGSTTPVTLSHYGMLSTQRLSSQSLSIGRSSRRTAVSAIPFANSHGIGNIAHYPMLSGSRVVQLTKGDPAACLAAIERWRSNMLLATYDVLASIVAVASRIEGKLMVEGRAYDVGSLDVIFVHELRGSAADKVRAKLAHLFRARLVELYGFIETGLVAGIITECPRLPGSVGVLCPSVTARVVNAGRDVDDGDFGEILVSTPRLATIGEEARYFSTGDYGTVTQSGVVIVKARLADLIHMPTGAVVPADIESRLLDHPAVADCAAVATASSRAVSPCVFIVSSDNCADSADAIVAPLREEFPGIRARFVGRIPRCFRGEPDRAALRDMLAGQAELQTCH